MIESVLAHIQTIMVNTSLTEQFYEAVLKRLVSLGYELKEDDGWMISFEIQKTENHIKNTCNITSIPDGLFYVAVDMVCGGFLFTKKQTGQLDIATLDLAGCIASLSEGDTSVSYDTSASDEQKFNTLVQFMMNGREGDLVCFRKMKW